MKKKYTFLRWEIGRQLEAEGEGSGIRGSGGEYGKGEGGKGEGGGREEGEGLEEGEH